MNAVDLKEEFSVPIQNVEEKKPMLFSEIALLYYAAIQQSTTLELTESSNLIINADDTGRPSTSTEHLLPTEEGMEELVRDSYIEMDHMRPLKFLERKLETDFDSGLTVEKADYIRQRYGSNTVTPPRKQYAICVIAKLCISHFNLLLWVAALLFALCYKPLGEPNPEFVNLAIAGLIVLVIVFNVVFTFYQERKSRRIVASFKDVLPQKSTVLRDGIEQNITAAQLVPGDIVLLRAGDKVPADCRILECRRLKVNNSALTGESVSVSCSDQYTSKHFMESANYVLSSALITEGSGRAVCCKTGDRTVIGRVSLLVNKDHLTKSSLHSEIDRVVYIIVGLAVGTGIIATIGYFAFLKPQHPLFMSWASVVANILSLMVAYVPEGLPICVAVTVTVIAQRMYHQNILVKSLGTLHTFNYVNLGCSDKTGTLTTGKMSVVNFMYGKNATVCWNALCDKLPDSGIVLDMLQVSALCNDAKMAVTPGEPSCLLGDPVDIALYHLLQEMGSPLETVNAKYSRFGSLPFNSRDKMMITLSKEHHKSFIACLKGAAESVLPRCSRMMCEDGTFRPLTADMVSALNDQQRTLGISGYRVIAMAHQYFSTIPPSSKNETLNGLPTTGYCFLGYVSLLDPPRPHVPGAVVKMKHAGIRVAMVTGDHQSTAHAIACKVNIFSPNIGVSKLSTCQTAQDCRGCPMLEILCNGRKVASHLRGTSNFIATDDRVLGSVKELMDFAQIAPGPQCRPECASGKDAMMFADSNMRVCSNNGTLYTGGVIVSGPELSLFDECMWDWCLVHQELVFARTTPEQKLKIVRSAQERREVVVVTGDGVDDAPALRAANVGVAMQSGTEVSRESAHMVLLNNSFNSLVEAVETGRLVSENLKKVCLFLLPAGTWSEMTPVMASVFFGLPLPLSTFLMILLCMFTDVVLCFALVFEKAENDLMARPPGCKKNSDGHLVNSRVIFHAFVFLGMWETFAAFVCWFWYFSDMGFAPKDLLLKFEQFGSTGDARFMAMNSNERAAYVREVVWTGQSIFFMALVMLQFFNVLATRTRYVSILTHNPLWGPTRNLKIPLAMSMSILIAVMVTRISWFQEVFKTRGVPPKYVMPPLGFGMGLLLLDEARKFFVRRRMCCLTKIAW